jgi:FlaA1/EpsC-like NDP-sugar epimerase
MLGKILSDHQIEQLLISTPRISEARLAEIARECEARNIELKRMSIRIESIDDSPLTSIARSASDGDL